jgi:cyclase
MELHEVAPHVHAVLQPEGGLGASNSGFVDRDGGLVIDSFWDLPRTREMRSLYASVNPSPPRRLLNTHNNGDHCWGNQLFAEDGTEILGHRRCAEKFGNESPELLQSLADGTGLPPAFEHFSRSLRRFDFHGITPTPPTTLLDGDTELELGDTEVRLLYVGPAHTAGDMVAYLPEEGVVFTGDILFNQCTPIGWEGTFEGWTGALQRLADLEPAVVVPGHGPICGVDELLGMKAYLEYVYGEARTHFEAGRSSIEAARRIELGPYLAWEEPERLAFQVDRAYRELEGKPWDTRVDITKVFTEAAELREHLRPGNGDVSP